MEYRKVKFTGIKDEISVSRDGKDIKYQGKTVHQSLIKSGKQKHGFYQVCISGKPIYVHHLVAHAFVHNPKPLSYKMILHKNCVSTDNEADNLEWGDGRTLYENQNKNGVLNNQSIEFRGRSTISYEDAVKIAQRLDAGESGKVLAVEFNVSEMSIARIRKKYSADKVKSIRYPKEIKENVIRLCKSYDTVTVSTITSIPYHTVYRWYRQAQLKNNK